MNTEVDRAGSEYSRQLEVIAKRNRCHCGAFLAVAWGGAYGMNEHILRCAKGHINEQTVREPTLWELWQRGELDDPYIADKFRKKEQKRMAEQGLVPAVIKNLEAYQNKGVLTRREAFEVVTAIWGDAPVEDRTRAAILCADYHLHPLKRHVFLIPFENRKTGKKDWSLVLGIGATRLMGARVGPVSNIDDSPRLMSEAEQTKVFGKVDKDNIVAIAILQDPKTGAIARGYGRWPTGESPRGTDSGNTKENMAFIRAERQALDRLRPGEMPGGVDVVDETFMDVPKPTVTTIAPEGVDQETGEITEPAIEGEYTEEPAVDVPTSMEVEGKTIEDYPIIEQPPAPKPAKATAKRVAPKAKAEKREKTYTGDDGVRRCNLLRKNGNVCGDIVKEAQGQWGLWWSCPNFKEHA